MQTGQCGTGRRIALAPFLKGCPPVRTLGIRPAMADYTEEERRLMREADRIFFPSARFVTVLQAIDKPTFPSAASYLYRRSRMHQQTLLKVLRAPHGKTRIYFGARQKERIREEFHLPVEVMAPVTHPGKVHYAEDWLAVMEYAALYNPVIVREARPITDCIQITSVQFACVGAARGVYAQGAVAIIAPLDAHDPALSCLVSQTEWLTRTAGLDDIALEWGLIDGLWQILQIARPPLHIESPGHTLHRHDYICTLIESGAL